MGHFSAPISRDAQMGYLGNRYLQMLSRTSDIYSHRFHDDVS
jgi:hypothetical protein